MTDTKPRSKSRVRSSLRNKTDPVAEDTPTAKKVEAVDLSDVEKIPAPETEADFDPNPAPVVTEAVAKPAEPKDGASSDALLDAREAMKEELRKELMQEMAEAKPIDIAQDEESRPFEFATAPEPVDEPVGTRHMYVLKEGCGITIARDTVNNHIAPAFQKRTVRLTRKEAELFAGRNLLEPYVSGVHDSLEMIKS